MPLSRRRRRKQVTAPLAVGEIKLHDRGMSYLEQLPHELLVQIFVYSRNVSLAWTSRTLYDMLGDRPSEWLIMQFLKPQKGERMEAALTRAVKLRGFTINVYDRWIKEFGMPFEDGAPVYNTTPPLSRRLDGVLTPKRWLRPENEALLISLLKQLGRLDFRNEQPQGYPFLATLSMAAGLLIDPRVSIDYARALQGSCEDAFMQAQITSYIILALISRPGVTADMLFEVSKNSSFTRYEVGQDNISRVAFVSRNPEVVHWALRSGMAPSAAQLKEMSLDTSVASEDFLASRDTITGRHIPRRHQ